MTLKKKLIKENESEFDEKFDIEPEEHNDNCDGFCSESLCPEVEDHINKLLVNLKSHQATLISKVVDETLDEVEKWVEENKLFASESLIDFPYIKYQDLLSKLKEIKN